VKPPTSIVKGCHSSKKSNRFEMILRFIFASYKTADILQEMPKKSCLSYQDVVFALPKPYVEDPSVYSLMRNQSVTCCSTMTYRFANNGASYFGTEGRKFVSLRAYFHKELLVKQLGQKLLFYRLFLRFFLLQVTTYGLQNTTF